MYSSKTSTLLIDLTRYSDVGLPVLYINSQDDTRGDVYSTHNSSLHQLSKKVETKKAVHLEDIPDEELGKYKVIGIDESQFFDDLVPFVKKLLKMKKIIYVSGLDGDVNQNLFGKILYLIPYASEVRKLTAVCEKCKEFGRIVPANVTISRTKRIHSPEDTTPVKEIGAKEKYVPVCNDCLFHQNESRIQRYPSIDDVNFLI
jgi:thymidine kinase